MPLKVLKIILIYYTDFVTGFNIGKAFTKINGKKKRKFTALKSLNVKNLGSRNIFSATSGPAIERHHCAFKRASVPYCDIWEYKVVFHTVISGNTR